MSTQSFNNIARSELGVDEHGNQSSIADECQRLREVIVSNFDERIWFMTKAALATIATLALKDQQNPVGLNFIGPASSGKTTVFSFLYGYNTLIFRTDNFTPASFVSHSAKATEKKLSGIDLLPKIRGKCIVIPELAPIFGTNRDELLASFSILTRVFDGEGMMTDSGSHGHRGYEGDYYFAWLGASVPIKKTVWNTMANLGSRLLFLVVPNGLSPEDRKQKVLTEFYGKDAYKARVLTCREAVHTFLDFITAQSDDRKEDSGDLEHPNRLFRSVEWNRHADPPEIVDRLYDLAVFAATVRQEIAVWPEEGERSFEANYNQPIREEPHRLLSVLYALARGHSLIHGRTQLTEEDLPLVIEVALSSIPDDRRDAIDALLSGDHPDKLLNPGEMTSTELTKMKKISKPKALKLFQTLEVLEIVDFFKEEGPKPARIELKPRFRWLLGVECQGLRRNWIDGIEPFPGSPI